MQLAGIDRAERAWFDGGERRWNQDQTAPNSIVDRPVHRKRSF